MTRLFVAAVILTWVAAVGVGFGLARNYVADNPFYFVGAEVK